MTMLATSPVEKSYVQLAEHRIELTRASKDKILLEKIAAEDIKSFVDFAEWTDKIEKNSEIIYILYCNDGIVAMVIGNPK